jgi:hypothetical protein
MESAWIASMLLNPAAILILCVIVATSWTLAHSDDGRNLSYRNLAFGYLGVVVMCLLIAAAASYVPPDEAQARWHVAPDDYWSATLQEFIVQSTLFIYLSLLGVSLVGLPVILALKRRGFGNVPAILAASIVISVLFTVLLTMVLDAIAKRPGASFTKDALVIVGGHLLLTLAFCVGAGFPWTIKRQTRLN